MYPSQIRYQYRNPVLSFRVPREVYEELEETARLNKQSIAETARSRVKKHGGFDDAFKRSYEAGIKKGKRELEERIKEAHERGYKEGVEALKKDRKALIEDAFKEGFKTGKEKYEITYPCSVCGEMTTMYPNQNDHKAMKEYMQEHGWKHGDCEE